MDEYWKTFWDKHFDHISSDNLFQQVYRTKDKQPMSKALFLKNVAHVREKLDLDTNHVVLDLCCGNGLFSVELAKHCQNVIGVDFSKKPYPDIASTSA